MSNTNTSTNYQQDEKFQARITAIVKHLEAATKKQRSPKQEVKWKLSRIVWRCGELRIAESLPYLIQVAGFGKNALKKSIALEEGSKQPKIAKTETALLHYSLAWAIGRLGTGDTASIGVLENYAADSNKDDMVRRIAQAGLVLQYKGEQQIAFNAKLIAQLPAIIQPLVAVKDADLLKMVIGKLLSGKEKNEQTYHVFLDKLYLLSNAYPHIKQALQNIFQDIELKPNTFKYVRHIFKIAEMWQDSTIYGLLAYRFEKTPSNFKKRRWNRWVYNKETRRYVRTYERFDKEMQKDDSSLAYSDVTKDYLRRRISRSLRRLGEVGNPDYVKLAVGILLSFKDSDAQSTWSTVAYRWERDPNTRRWRSNYTKTNYDKYARYLAFNEVLYGNSQRYQFNRGQQAWACAGEYQPGAPAPKEREEAYPQLWDQRPEGLIHLLVESNCAPVHQFACKVVKAHPEIVERIDLPLIIIFLNKPYAPTNELALHLAIQKYDPSNPNVELALALYNCQLETARSVAKGWIGNQRDFFFKDSNVVRTLVMSPFSDNRKWAAHQMKQVTFSEQDSKVIVVRLMTELLSLDGQDKKNNEVVKDIGNILVQSFPTQMRSIGLNVVQDLLQHPLYEMQVFAGRILIQHNTPTEQLPDEILSGLVNSSYPQVRKVGIELFGTLPDSVLLQKETALLNFCLSKQDEVRTSIRPIIGKLADAHKAFGERMMQKLAPIMLMRETYKGLHDNVSSLMTNELKNYLYALDNDLTWRLLRSKKEANQTLGAALLQNNIKSLDVPMRQIVTLASHQVADVRQWVWKSYQNHTDRIKYEREEAVRVLDATWDDSREFGFDFFRNSFTEDDWTPELLVSICDSVRPEVQTFGQELITKFFAEENGIQYLLKLSQHPTNELQAFAAQYLEQFASGQLEHIAKLEHYFLTVLSQVNKGRVVKERIFQFLRTEGLNDPAVAEIALRIIGRLSATIAIGDKATCIELMRDLQSKFPHLDNPIHIEAVKEYEAA